MTMIILAALSVPKALMARLRAHRLRPCATVIVDFAEDTAFARIPEFLFVFGLVVLTAALAVTMTLLGQHPLVAVEIVTGVALLAPQITRRPGNQA